MSTLILFNKPFNVLSQFTDNQGRPTLASYINRSNVYPAGRLDANSEGLLLLTDDGNLQHRIAHPDHKLEKTYWVQLEGQITASALQSLREGVQLKDGLTRPAKARHIQQPDLWQRDPPVRYRANIPTCWVEIKISEGRNRQVRRMTAAVGFPTLRLIRVAIGDWQLNTLQPGELHVEEVSSPAPLPGNQTARRSNKTVASQKNKHNQSRPASHPPRKAKR